MPLCARAAPDASRPPTPSPRADERPPVQDTPVVPKRSLSTMHFVVDEGKVTANDFERLKGLVLNNSSARIRVVLSDIRGHAIESSETVLPVPASRP
jgi:hypothetical protein